MRTFGSRLLGVACFALLLGGTALAQEFVPVEKPEVLQFKLRVLNMERFDSPRNVTFRFFSDQQGQTLLHKITVPAVDLRDGIGPEVPFRSIDSDDDRKNLAPLFRNAVLYYSSQVQDRGESRISAITLGSVGTAAGGGSGTGRLPDPQNAELNTHANLGDDPVLIIDLSGAFPVARLSAKDGVGKRRDVIVSNGEVRLIPESLVRVQVKGTAEQIKNVRITQNLTGNNNGVGADGGVNTRDADPRWFGEDSQGRLRAYLRGGAPLELWSAMGSSTRGSQEAMSDLASVQTWTTPAKKEDGSLIVPRDGNLAVTFDDGSREGPELQVRVLPGEEWSFIDAFEPFMAITHGTDIQFAALTKFKTFGFNSNLRIDTVAVITPGQQAADESGFLGVGLTWSPMWGSRYKTSGKPFFGFPVRFNFTLGLRALSFESHQKGNGQPFFGFGVQIPFGG